MSEALGPLFYSTRYNVPEQEFYDDRSSVLSYGEDVNVFGAQILRRMGSNWRLMQISLSEHAAQAKIAIGSCETLGDLKDLPRDPQLWQPKIETFINFRAENQPLTFLGGDGSFINASDADVGELPGGFHIAMNSLDELPARDPFLKTNITQIVGPDQETWNTFVSSRVMDETDLYASLISIGRVAGIDNTDHLDALALTVLHRLDPNYLAEAPTDGTAQAIGQLGLLKSDLNA